MTKKVISVFLALLLSMLMTVSVFAGTTGDEEAMGPWCEAVFTGTTRGMVCDVHLQLYHWLTADPMEDFRADMVYGFKVVISDGSGQILDEIWFPGGDGGYSMDFTLTEPGDYYFQVWSGRGFAQGRSLSPEVYDTSPHHVTVLTEAEMFPEESPAAQMAFAFMDACAQVGNEPEPAVLGYLEMIQWGGWASEDLFKETMAYLETILTDDCRPAYELLMNNEGYRTMAMTPLGDYDTAILYEDDFWKYEMWRELAKTGQLPSDLPPDAFVVGPADGSVPEPDGTGSDSIITDGALNADDLVGDAGGNPLPWIAIGGGAAAIAVVVLVLLKKKKK